MAQGRQQRRRRYVSWGELMGDCSCTPSGGIAGSPGLPSASSARPPLALMALHEPLVLLAVYEPWVGVVAARDPGSQAPDLQ